MCENKQCRKKFREYIELNSKQFEEIYGLENDIKEKEEFVQKLVKARNEFQSEAYSLKKKNEDLIKGNDYLVERAGQLENDSEKLNKSKSDLKDKLKLIEEEFDIDYDLAAKIRDTGDKLRQELAVSKQTNLKMEKKKAISDKLLKSLQHENSNLKTALESEIETKDKLKIKTELLETNAEEYSVKVEMTNETQRSLIQAFDEENKALKAKINDLEDEIHLKTKIVLDLEEQNQRASMTSSNSSLKEELDKIQSFDCEDCNSNFASYKNLRVHNRKRHVGKLLGKVALLEKMESLQMINSKQRSSLSDSVLELKKKEFEARKTCRCIGFCNITHLKHNYYRSIADQICEKMKTLTSDSEAHLSNPHANLGPYKKCYKCSLCEKEFTRQGSMKKHRKVVHKANVPTEVAIMSFEPAYQSNQNLVFEQEVADNNETTDSDSEETVSTSDSNSSEEEESFEDGEVEQEGGMSE